VHYITEIRYNSTVCEGGKEVLTDSRRKDFATESTVISRRDLLLLGVATAASMIIPSGVIDAASDIFVPEKQLSFMNTHTDEQLTARYWFQGEYLPDELAKINHILRDHRTGDVKPIDTELLDLLYTLHRTLRTDAPFHIISGYRSPRTNAALRKKNRGVAKNSLHQFGKAVDIRLPRHNLKKLRNTAKQLQGGGVGYYPHLNFVHIDVGNVRYWRG
jgi:uncharacterized protein YcbK (DUF882 family)